MKAVVQRVTRAAVRVGGKTVGDIGAGMLVLLGVGKNDTDKDAQYLARKIAQLRMFEDPDGKMNLAAGETGAQALVVSQFTLYGDCAKGRRPSFDGAAEPKTAQELYQTFVAAMRQEGLKVETGEFRAMMEVELVNDGPVTFILESA